MPVRKVISTYDDDDIDGNDSVYDIDDNDINDDIDFDSDKEPGAWHTCSDARA